MKRITFEIDNKAHALLTGIKDNNGVSLKYLAGKLIDMYLNEKGEAYLKLCEKYRLPATEIEVK